jgi:hypothetical protein
MPNWKKVLVSGSDASLNSLFVLTSITGSSFTGSFTGSLFGTASWSQNSISSSFASTASFVRNAVTASYVLNAVSSSFAISASYALQAQNAVSSTSPISFNGTTLYSTQPAAGSTVSSDSIFFGREAGLTATVAFSSAFLLYQAGKSATNANNSIFIGEQAGFEATNANNSVIIGQSAGFQSSDASYSVLIGHRAGYGGTGGFNSITSNNIVIGTNITLPILAKDSINIGGIIFGTGSYSTTTGTPSSTPSNGRIGINVVSPVYGFDVSGSGNFRNGLTVTGSLIAPSITGSLFGTSSWAENAVTSSYVLQAVSSSFAATASSADSFLVRSSVTASNALITGTITAQTLVVSTVSSSVVYSSGSNIFGNSLSNVQQFTGSIRVTGSGNHFILGGNVGIGTTSPAEKLTVQQTASSQGIRIIGNSGGFASLDIEGDRAVGNLGGVKFTKTGDATSIFEILPQADRSAVYLNTGNGVISPTTKVAITQAGNVLIGSTTDDTVNKLQVSGSANITGNLTVDTNTLFVDSINNRVGIGTASPVTNLDIVGGVIGIAQNKIDGGSDNLKIMSDFANISANSTIEFSIDNSEKMRIATTGNVLVGTTTDNTIDRLQVSGSANITGKLTVSGSLIAPSITGSLFGTSSWAQNSISASYAPDTTFPFTGSALITGSLGVTGSISIGSALLDFNQNTNVVTGSYQVIASEATASYRTAFFDYVIFSGSISRAGTIYTVWSGSTTEWYENYTSDIGGSTNGVQLQTAISSGNIQLQATASTAAWTIRSLVRML